MVYHDLPTEEQWRMPLLKELLDVRRGAGIIPGIEQQEIDDDQRHLQQLKSSHGGGCFPPWHPSFSPPQQHPNTLSPIKSLVITGANVFVNENK